LSSAVINSKLPVQLRTVRMIYFMAGTGISAWAIIVPFSKIRFGLDDGTLGLILLSPGIGGIIAMPFCGMLIKAFGSRATLLGASLVFGVILPLLTVAPTPLALTVLLFFYGLTFGAMDIGMNGQAVVVEARSGRRQMSSFHALYSIGSLVIALATSFLLRLGLTNAMCSALSAAVIFAILTQTRHLLPKADDLPSDGPTIALPNRATIVLGLCCFACFLTEGAVTDWSTIFLRFSRNLPLSTAALGYAAFSIAMAGSRLFGDRVAMRLGAARVMRLGCGLAGAGLLAGVMLPYGVAGIVAFFFVGLGIGNIAPLVFSAAARVPGMTANLSVPAVVSLGYVGFLIGPVIIGFIAHHLGLPFALGLDAALLFVISFAAEAVAA
jgi:MFS family permease